MKKLISIFLCFVMTFSLFGCGETSESENESQSTEPSLESEETTVEESYAYPESNNGVYDMKALEGWIKINERQYFKPNGRLTCDWSLDGFAMNINAVGGTFKVTYEANYEIYFSVHIDGAETVRPCCAPDATEFSFDVPAGEHSIHVMKDTQVGKVNGDYCDLLSLAFEGEILKPEGKKDLYIEVIGDSIACGDGVLGKYKAGEAWVNKDHSATHAFPYNVSKAFDADISVVARGGIGLLKASGDYTTPDLYDYANLYRDETPYDFKRTPDIVVVELGANDGDSTEEEYYTALARFVDRLRSKYGEAPYILWAGKSERNYNCMQKYINVMKSRDSRLGAVRHDYGGAGSAALVTQTSGHPDVTGQTMFANAIIAALQKVFQIDR